MRFYIFTIMIVGIILVLNLGGVVTPIGGGLAKAINLVDDNQNLTIQDVKSSNVWNSTDLNNPGIKYILTIFLVGGLVIGIVGRSPDIRYGTALFVFIIAGLILTDLVYLGGLVIGMEGWIKFALGTIIGGLIAGFIVTTLQFWQGTD